MLKVNKDSIPGYAPLSNIPETQDQLALSCRDSIIYKVGKDALYSFGETIKLLDGTPLKVSPDDDLYRFEVLTKDSNKKYPDVHLPFSLFNQALTKDGDHISFFHGERRFDFQLTTHQNYFKEIIPFFECMNSYCKDFSSTMYLDSCDIPDDYFKWSVTPNLRVELSPNAERITIGQKGCTPLDSKELYQVSDGKVQTHSEHITQYAGLKDRKEWSVWLGGGGNFNCDLVIDRDCFYIFVPPGFSGDVRLIKEKFIWKSLKSEGKLIDKNNISASWEKSDPSRLYISFPFMPESIPKGEEPLIQNPPFTIKTTVTWAHAKKTESLTTNKEEAKDTSSTTNEDETNDASSIISEKKIEPDEPTDNPRCKCHLL